MSNVNVCIHYKYEYVFYLDIYSCFVPQTLLLLAFIAPASDVLVIDIEKVFIF